MRVAFFFFPFLVFPRKLRFFPIIRGMSGRLGKVLAYPLFPLYFCKRNPGITPTVMEIINIIN